MHSKRNQGKQADSGKEDTSGDYVVMSAEQDL